MAQVLIQNVAGNLEVLTGEWIDETLWTYSTRKPTLLAADGTEYTLIDGVSKIESNGNIIGKLA